MNQIIISTVTGIIIVSIKAASVAVWEKWKRISAKRTVMKIYRDELKVLNPDTEGVAHWVGRNINDKLSWDEIVPFMKREDKKRHPEKYK